MLVFFFFFFFAQLEILTKLHYYGKNIFTLFFFFNHHILTFLNELLFSTIYSFRKYDFCIIETVKQNADFWIWVNLHLFICIENISEKFKEN